MASDCRYGASEESRVRGTWSRKENAARTAPRYLCVAHSWKVFSGMLQKMPRSGVAASAATWHILLRAGVSSVHTWRTSAPRLVSSVLSTPLWAIRSDASIPFSEGQGRGYDRSGTGSPHLSLAKTPRRLDVIHVTCDSLRMLLIQNALLILTRDTTSAYPGVSAKPDILGVVEPNGWWRPENTG